jgi:hypothetical protein
MYHSVGKSQSEVPVRGLDVDGGNTVAYRPVAMQRRGKHASTVGNVVLYSVRAKGLS